MRTRKRPSTSGSLRSSPAIASSSPSGFPSTPSFPHATARSGTLASHARSKRQPPRGRLSGGGRGANGQLGGDGNAARSTHTTSKKDGRRGRRASSDTREEKTAGAAGAAAVNAKDDATALESVKEVKQVEEVTATPQSDQNRLGPKWKRGSERCSSGGHPQGARRGNNNSSNKANYSKSHHNNRKGRGGDGGESRSASNERNEHESSEDREGEEEEKEEGEEDLSGVTPAASATADAVQPPAKHNAKARQQLETTTHNVTPRQNKKNKNNNIAGAVPTQKVKGNIGGAAPQATSTAAARNSRGATDVAPRPPGPATALQRGTAVKSKSNTTATAALSGAQTAAAAAAVSHRRPSAPRTEGPPCVIAELPPDPCLVKVVCAAGVAVLPPSPSLNATATPEMQVDSASLPAAAAAASVMTTATLTMPSGGAGSDKGEEEKDLRRRGLRVDAAPWCPPPLFSLPVDLTGRPPPPPLPSLHDAAAASAAALHTGLSHAHTLGIFATPAPATHNGFAVAAAAGQPTLGSGGAALFAAPSVLAEAGHREAAPAVTITSTLSKMEGKNHSGAAAAETAAAAVTSLVGAAVAHSPSPTPPSLHPRRVGVAVLPITADAVATASTQANSAAGWQQREVAALAGGAPVCSPPSLSGSSPASSLSMAPSPSAIQPEWSPLYDRGRSSDHVTPTLTTTTTVTALPPAGGDGENDSSSGATAAAALVHGAVATGPLNESGVGVVPTHASVRPAAGHPIAVPATAAAAVMATVVGRWNTHSSPPSSVMREDDSDSGGVGTPLLMSPALEPHMRTATTAATESMTRAMVYGGGGSLSSVSGMVGGAAQSATVDRASSSGRGGISGSVSTTAEGGVEERPATAPAIRRPAMTVTNTATGARVSSSSLTTPAGSPLGPWATAAAAAAHAGAGGGAGDGSVRAAIANSHHYSSSGSGTATLTPALAAAGGHAQYATLGSGGGAGGVRSASSMERYSTREFPAVPFTTTTTAAAASSPYSRHSPPLQQQQPLVMSLSPHTQHSSPAGVMVVGVSSPSGQSSHSNSPQLSQHNSSSLPLGALQFPSMAAAGSGMVHTPSPSLSAQHHHHQQQRSHTPLFSPSITGESDLDRVRHNRVAVSDMAAKNENTLVDTLFADADADVIEDDESELDVDDGSPNSGSAAAGGGRGGGEWWPAYPMGTSPHSAVYSPDAYTRSYVTQQQQQQQQQAYSYAYASSPTASGVYTSFGGGYWNQVGGTRHSGGGAGGAHAAGNTSGGGSSSSNNNAAAHHSRSHFSPSGIGGHRQLSTSCASVASSTLSLLDPRQPPPTDLGAAVYGLGEDEEEWEMNSSAYADSLDEAQIQWIEEQLKATENPVGYF